MTDWVVWPIFVVQLFTFSLYFLRVGFPVLKIPVHFWIISLMLLVDVAIVLSLIHDSTDQLHLFF